MTTNNGLYKPKPRIDVLHWRGIGRFLRWRHGRLFGQLLLLFVAIIVVYDGLTGPPFAPENLATNTVWLQYRGFVMLALLLVGNLFCMNCPFTIPRSLARKWSGTGRRWPRTLRNKWVALAVLFVYLFLYEWLDLWASPWLTAWIVVAYFVSSFILEFFFAESPFCKYICPLGTFNYVGSTISPLQIQVTNQEVCRTCVGKECVNGSQDANGKILMLGCGTELFPPQITSNLNCTLCLDCTRACPHDNIGLVKRPWLNELKTARAWPRRWDLSLLVWVFTFAGLSNAFGMTPPIYQLAAWLSGRLQTTNEGILLLLIFAMLNLILPFVMGVGTAWGSNRLSRVWEPLRITFSKYTPILVPFAFAVWLAHYGFHFATGAFSIIPATQNFLIDHGIYILGSNPNWLLSNIVPLNWLLPLQLIILIVGFGGSYYVLTEIGRHEKASFVTQLPWLLLLFMLAITAVYLFNLPMEMRGTGLMH